MHITYTNFATDPPPCKGRRLPNNLPFYFERFYEGELDYFVKDGRKRNVVPSHISAYRDDTNMLFSMVFSRVKNATACEVLSSASPKQVKDKTKALKKTHRIQTASCYFNDNNKLKCIAVFCPKKEVPSTKCDLHQSYTDYQNKLIKQQDKGNKVFYRKIYFKGKDLVVDVCYQKEQRNKEFGVSLYDQIDHNTLIQTIERNEQRGLYLADGNARLDGNRLVYSAVFSSIKYGKCDYKVLYNADAGQLYERERALADQGYHISTIIPTTGNLTPLFIAVFWR